MALTPEIRASQARILVTAEMTATLEVSALRVLAAINFPTESIEVSQLEVRGLVNATVTMQVSGLRVLAAVTGRVENRRLRAWPASLDGHDFYILRLGDSATLVFDLTTGQWSEWRSGELPFFRAHLGQFWAGMGAQVVGQGFRTQIVAGDDTFGLLWILDPEQGFDDHPQTDGMVPFDRTVTGLVPMRLRQTAKCNEVYLTANLGEPAITGAAVTLRTSDDAGRSWHAHGTITISPDDWTQEVAWRSLGIIVAPGRLFELTDNGAAVRISSLDMR